MIVGGIATVSVGAVESAGGGTEIVTFAMFESSLMSTVVSPSVHVPVSTGSRR